jgi:hypothetical protein
MVAEGEIALFRERHGASMHEPDSASLRYPGIGFHFTVYVQLRGRKEPDCRLQTAL